MNTPDFNKLNATDKRIYHLANFVIFFLLAIFALLMLARVIFPSQFFTYSFTNVNSLKNTITDVVRENAELSFYASTPLNFSQLNINLELSNSTSNLEGQNIRVYKSYKAFFYPEATPLENLEGIEENKLVSVDDSVYIIGSQKKTPIDSTVTFESLGYNWNNLKKNTADLSQYEKQKLADINAAHPTGTILRAIPSENYYFIENFTKKKVIKPSTEKIQNAIAVDEKSLVQGELCVLKKSKFFSKNYSCTIPLSQITAFTGKDYRFALANLPANIQFKKIDLEFKKSLDRSNFQVFLSDLKKKVLYRFGVKDE